MLKESKNENQRIQPRMTTLDEVRKRDAGYTPALPEDLGFYNQIVEKILQDRRWLLARVDELAEALRGLHDDNVDYLRLNHLGGYDNHWLKAAREALARLESPAVEKERAEFKHFHRLLCERFGYAHDEIDWKLDQLSLIEHIANSMPQRGLT